MVYNTYGNPYRIVQARNVWMNSAIRGFGRLYIGKMALSKTRYAPIDTITDRYPTLC